MTTLALSLPVAGQTTNAVADPMVDTAFTTILAWANGNIDATNVSGVLSPLQTTATNLAATVGQLLFCYSGAATTVTLPAGPAAGNMVGIVAINNSTVITVQGNGHTFEGLGLGAASSFQLGAPGANALLMYTGQYWIFLGGQQDSGWQAITLGSGWAAAATMYTPQARLMGDRVWLRGGATGSSNTPGTIPSGLRPASVVLLPFTSVTSGGAYGSAIPTLQIPTNGVMSLASGVPNSTFSYDGLSYSII